MTGVKMMIDIPIFASTSLCVMFYSFCVRLISISLFHSGMFICHGDSVVSHLMKGNVMIQVRVTKVSRSS